jgi:hypothetical protein
LLSEQRPKEELRTVQLLPGAAIHGLHEVARQFRR